jgi:hypothetical protein
MRHLAAACLVALALAGCRSPGPLDGPRVGAIHGRIAGVEGPPPAARVQIYRLDEGGRPTPDPFESVLPDADGRFTTGALSPGRYRIVYRRPGGPPSITTIRVPTTEPVVLRPLVEEGLVALSVRTPAQGQQLRCRLTEARPEDGIPDIREFTCAGDSIVPVVGVRPGRWWLDLPDLGATTEVVVERGVAVRDLTIDVPPAESGGVATGVVRQIDGAAGAWLVVSARPLDESGETAIRWGRYAITDRSGRYRIVGIPPGPTLLRIECRESPARILPAAQIVVIPPSGTVEMGFVVEP